MVINYVSDINPSKEPWRIVVRVTHLWHGDKIQASIKRSMIMTYRHLLNEGESYTLMTFRVGLNSGDYKPISHAYKINFLSITKVEVNCDASIPLYGS
ncbi:Glyceraldehyde-3-phosphate dehydrogenase A chloroplastic, partial [Bienertia sinuspersici]